MVSVQDSDEIRAICGRLRGKRIAHVQVLGVNALKSIKPDLDDLVGEAIVGCDVSDRTVTLHTVAHAVKFDLQRTGRVVWLADPVPYQTSPGAMPTARVITEDGGLDLIEPAKTKRITVTLADRVE